MSKTNTHFSILHLTLVGLKKKGYDVNVWNVCTLGFNGVSLEYFANIFIA